jgi:hypothetical protein
LSAESDIEYMSEMHMERGQADGPYGAFLEHTARRHVRARLLARFPILDLTGINRLSVRILGITRLSANRTGQNIHRNGRHQSGSEVKSDARQNETKKCWKQSTIGTTADLTSYPCFIAAIGFRIYSIDSTLMMSKVTWR